MMLEKVTPLLDPLAIWGAPCEQQRETVYLWTEVPPLHVTELSGELLLSIP